MKHFLAPPSGTLVFFTHSLAKPGDDLLVLQVEKLRQAVRITRAERPFGIEAWVVLPDHLHAIWRLPDGDTDFAGRWAQIRRRFAVSVPRQPRHKVWRRDYHAERIHGLTDLIRLQRLCAQDPVNHGLVDTPAEWPFSSFGRGQRPGDGLHNDQLAALKSPCTFPKLGPFSSQAVTMASSQEGFP